MEFSVPSVGFFHSGDGLAVPFNLHLNLCRSNADDLCSAEGHVEIVS